MQGETLMSETKVFLADFTFRSGEAEMPFHHTLLAKNIADAESKIDRYFRDFGPDVKPIGYLCFEYQQGYYAVLYEGLEQSTPERVVQHLMIPGTAR